ncbi:SDR family NAD(P)-dependent oxidoreductase [Streptomyces syringium]|uniref:SDR family NAD(P)-dependent oxidoreductase n=1 Tax=Streptomyces syringium TaxID=76729 RepID=UPI00344A9651
MGTNGVREQGQAIAIIGISCRLPGGIHDLDGLWRALRDGRDMVGRVPEDRFDIDRFVDPAGPRIGKSYTDAGGFLDDIAQFDAAYFGISPKEAAHMDPQHRLLLELAAEALDDAAIAPAALSGSDTSVYVGISDASYGALQMTSVRSLGPYTLSGFASSIAANRLSYAFDLRGPSMAVDTACSSSLVALDRACRTLWEGGCSMALCGGVNIVLSPFHYVGFSQASMLSVRGHCAAFSAHADGFVRAEGGGVVVLKPLAGALADGDRIHGVILGTGSNCDGRTMGLALPNPQAQEDLLRAVYAEAGVDPDELVYFEAHGTGTPAGDPAEATAIGRALGVRRISGELPIGSVKTNLGHLEPASGMAGLCKALLVLKHGVVPASLHADPPSPHIDFTGLGLAPVPESRPVAPTERPVVGINSFGFGGANAHTIVTRAPQPAETGDVPPTGSPLPLLVSAGTPAALAQAAGRLAERLATAADGEFYDLAYTSCVRRGRHEHRAVVLARTAEEAAAEFAALAQADSAARVLPPARGPGPVAAAGTGRAVRRGQVAFVFSGNGSQWAGMATDLLGRPVFRETVARVDAELAPWLGWSVAEALAAPPERWRLEATEIAQPLLFAVQLGVVAELREHGIEPSMVLGHSVGEVAAAHVGGALPLDRAARVIAARSRAQGATAGRGRMAAVGLSPDRAARELEAYAPSLEIAGLNSPRDVTVSGPAEGLAALGRELGRRGVFFRDLGLDYAFHSRAMDPQRETFTEALEGLRPAALAVPLLSTVTGDLVSGAELDATYWWRNMREPVRFTAAARRAIASGADILVEIGPHPVLRTYLRRISADCANHTVVCVSTLSRDGNGPRDLTAAPATVIASDPDTHCRRYFPRRGRVAELPAYPWQRQRHWVGSPDWWVASRGAGRIDHPLLGERVPAPLPVWANTVEPVLAPWLPDHRIGGLVILPATAFAEMALAAGRCALGSPVEVEFLDIHSALVVSRTDPAAVRTQVSLNPTDGAVTITSTDENSEGLRTHARARVRTLLRPRPGRIDLDAVRARCPRRVAAEDFYRACADVGLVYGPGFQVLTELAEGVDEVVAGYHHDAPADPYVVHPALLDGALQAGVQLLAGRLAQGSTHLPASIGAVRVWEPLPPSGVIRAHERSRTDDEVCWDLLFTDERGTVMAELESCRLRRFQVAVRTQVTTHHCVLRAAPRAGEPCAPSPLPGSARLVAAVQDRVAALRQAWPGEPYERLTSLLKLGIGRGVAGALAAALPEPTGPWSLDDLVAAGVGDRLHRLLILLTPLMERHGLLTSQGVGRWSLTPADTTTDELLRTALNTSPASVAEIALSSHALASLTRDAREAREAGQTKETEEGLDEGGTGAHRAPGAEALFRAQFYDTSPVCRFHHRLAQALLAEMVRLWPAGRTLNVLEIGGGAGGTAAAVLPLLPADRTRYCFTDAFEGSLRAARKRFAAYDFVDYRLFDPDAEPAAQGYHPHGFDLVIAAHSLHTARDLERSLRQVATLLAPGGRLLGVEAHDAELEAAIFGASGGLFGHTDTALRPASRLLPRDAWARLLEGCGYTDVVQLGHDRAPARDHYSLFLATGPAGYAEGQVGPDPLPDARAGAVFVVASELPQDQALARTTAELLDRAGSRSTRAVVASTSADEWGSLLAAVPDDDRASVETVTLALVLSDTPDGCDVLVTPETGAARATRRAALLRAAAATFERLPEGVHADLWLVTSPCGAVPTPDAITRPEDAAAWGAARSLANERPEFTGRRVSLHRGDTARDAWRLARELLEPTDEDEIVLTSAGRFVARERHWSPVRPADGMGTYTLRVRNPGLSYRLVWEEVEPPEPGPEDVVVSVGAIALNYRDTVQAAGLLPTEAFEGTPSEKGPGFECAGVVTACGANVTGFAPGDRVAGFAHAALASHIVAEAALIWHIPEDVTFAQAASMPMALATAYYGLSHLARLRPGETVLVHGAAGGVGLAAVRHAQSLGARVIATAGSELKRDFVRACGVQHVLDSRSLEFTTQVMEITDGRGVDVVFNSLAGEAIARGLELLASGGRFLELGKRDIFANSPLALRPFGNDIAFFGVDVSKVLTDSHRVEAAEGVRRRLVQGVIDCDCLPHTVFPAARVEEAFHLLQHSRHIGKVVVAFDPLDEPPLVEPLPRPPRLDAKATYLVTGGTSGFGAATAKWFASLGARHLALVSRRGPEAPGVAELVKGLTAQGVHATAYAADVTDPACMRAVAERIDAGGRPLRGVAHCAMHLDDASLAELDDARFTAVLAPKMTGAMVLDALTRERECDVFLLHSSITALLGQIQQAPYSAGNVFLEALARERRQAGLPGDAVQWGVIGEVGYAARNDLLRSLTAFGIEPLAPSEAFAAAEALLTARVGVAGIARCNWATLGGMLPSLATPRFGMLAPSRGKGGAPREDLLRELSQVSTSEALARITESLTGLIAHALHMDPGQLDPHRRLDEYGLDSLMAAEFLVALQQRYGVDIPPLELLRSQQTVADIARLTHQRLGLG